MKRPRLGDIVQVSTTNGFAYAQLTHRNPMMGFLLRILPGLYPKPLTNFTEKVCEKELYHTFVFREDLTEPPVTSIVGHEPVPERCRAFPLFRTGVRDPKTSRVPTWWLWDGNVSWPIGTLIDEQRHLSLRQIWNYKILADRAGRGWLPTDEC